jgi:hypothetical protein
MPVQSRPVAPMFDDLLGLVLAPLETDRPELCQSIRDWLEVIRADPEDYGDATHVFGSALQDYPNEYPPGWWLDDTYSRWWLSICVDIKDSDQIQWQVQAMIKCLQLEQDFVSQIVVGPCEVHEQLSEAAQWFRSHGYELLCLDTQSSDFVVVPVRLELLRQACEILNDLGIRSFLYRLFLSF